jgi:hypothetical protein
MKTIYKTCSGCRETKIPNDFYKNSKQFHVSKNLEKEILKRLPYTADELRLHIESLWEPWMNWDNYGKFDKNKKTWQIDHIIPQSKLPFDFLDHKNFLKLWALENLQPLETIANIKKGNKIIPKAA